MNKVALLFGGMLILIGLIGYFGSSGSDKPTADKAAAASGAAGAGPAKRSFTALIPAIFGAALTACGLWGSMPAQRKNAMHIAAGVGVLGTIGGGMRFVPSLLKQFGGDPNVNQRAMLFTGLLTAISLVYVVLSVRSFIAARRARAA
jgi:hypothetical protein